MSEGLLQALNADADHRLRSVRPIITGSGTLYLEDQRIRRGMGNFSQVECGNLIDTKVDNLEKMIDVFKQYLLR